MSNRDDYNALLPAIQAIPDDRIRTLSQPVDSFLQEAENLYHWALDDQESLRATGLGDVFLEELPVRAGALREAESIWFTRRFTRTGAQRQWKAAEPEAYELRSDLLADFRYAFRKSPDLLSRVSAIAGGRGHADMIQDLNDLAALGRENLDALNAIGFDPSRLDYGRNQSG